MDRKLETIGLLDDSAIDLGEAALLLAAPDHPDAATARAATSRRRRRDC
jgi:hypothetical protein